MPSTHTTLTLQRPDGQTVAAACFLPAQPQPGQPGLVLLHEWWGLDPATLDIGRRLADAGHVVLAPDFYRGTLAQTPQEAAQLKAGLDMRLAAEQDVAACVAWLREAPRQVGVLGFCMGGALTLAAAALTPGLDAAVCFYGIPPAKVADLATIRIPFQGHFAQLDDWCTPAAVATLEAQLMQAGLQPDFHSYPAHHAFLNHRRADVYDPQQAALAWQRTLAFFATHLGA
ncbi:MAG: hypothetical protein RI907_368 [Pseudomonadota bacterium]|jgi:carboxymethylenebutenolidase